MDYRSSNPWLTKSSPDTAAEQLSTITLRLFGYLPTPVIRFLLMWSYFPSHTEISMQSQRSERPDSHGSFLNAGAHGLPVLHCCAQQARQGWGSAEPGAKAVLWETRLLHPSALPAQLPEKANIHQCSRWTYLKENTSLGTTVFWASKWGAIIRNCII